MDIQLITNRRKELQAEAEGLEAKLAAIREELGELDIAQGVLERLSGKGVAQTYQLQSTTDGKPHRKKPEGLPTTRQMVLEALMDARARGLAGLAPRGIRQYVLEKYNYNMGAAANTVTSRMWRDAGEILKNEETGLFSLPKISEPEDDLISRSASSGSNSDNHVAQGRKAVPGGGP